MDITLDYEEEGLEVGEENSTTSMIDTILEGILDTEPDAQVLQQETARLEMEMTKDTPLQPLPQPKMKESTPKPVAKAGTLATGVSRDALSAA